jgi:hypothetical protein
MFTEQNILSILEKELIGKTIRTCSYTRPIIQEGLKKVKKSNSITNKQFESGNPKFYYLAINRVLLGTHFKFEDLKIKRIWFDYSEYDDGKVLKAELENGQVIDVQN